MKLWDKFEYEIADHYLSALINGDESGLSDAEARDLTAFCEREQASARRAGWNIGHWSSDSEEANFTRDDVSGMLANCAEVFLMVYADEPDTCDALRAAYRARHDVHQAHQVRILVERLRLIRESESDIETFTRAYIECALWSSTDENGDPLDDEFSADDVAAEARQSMREDCIDFLRGNRKLIRRYPLGMEHAGHDFWLTRNGHGAGFWDRGLGALGEQLTRAAKVYGSSDLYAGDDRKVYVS